MASDGVARRLSYDEPPAIPKAEADLPETVAELYDARLRMFEQRVFELERELEETRRAQHEKNESAVAEIAQLKNTRAGVVKALKDGDLGRVRAALAHSEDADEPDPDFDWPSTRAQDCFPKRLPFTTGDDLRFMQWNIKNLKVPKTGLLQLALWPERLDHIVDTIRGNAPDVVAIDEIEDSEGGKQAFGHILERLEADGYTGRLSKSIGKGARGYKEEAIGFIWRKVILKEHDGNVVIAEKLSGCWNMEPPSARRTAARAICSGVMLCSTC